MGDNLKPLGTHFDPVWRTGMYGVWATTRAAWTPTRPRSRSRCKGSGCSGAAAPRGRATTPGSAGSAWKKGTSTRRSDGRAAGHSVLPFLGWTHRFNRPFGPRYPVSVEDRVRNYLLTHNELGLDPGAGDRPLRAGVRRGARAAAGGSRRAGAAGAVSLLRCDLLHQPGSRDRPLGIGHAPVQGPGIDHRIRRFAAIDTPTSRASGARYPIAPSSPKPSGRAWTTSSCWKTTWSSRARPKMCWRRASPSCASGSGACCPWAGAAGTGHFGAVGRAVSPDPPGGDVSARCRLSPHRLRRDPDGGTSHAHGHGALAPDPRGNRPLLCRAVRRHEPGDVPLDSPSSPRCSRRTPCRSSRWR
jgi:hypothetical protein